MLPTKYLGEIHPHYHEKNKTGTPVIQTGLYPHMPIAVTASSGQFVTRASRLPGQFVAPG